MNVSDWNAIAEARGLDIPPEEIDEFALGLDALETALRELARQLNYSDEP